jgi:hypothetical protein
MPASRGTKPALPALQNVYSCLNPLINYFYPTKKLIAKDKLPNGKIKKVYEKQLKTPCQRFLEHRDIPDTLKKRVRLIKKSLDIVCLQEGLEKACDELDRIVNKNCAALSLGGRNG